MQERVHFEDDALAVDPLSKAFRQLEFGDSENTLVRPDRTGGRIYKVRAEKCALDTGMLMGVST